MTAARVVVKLENRSVDTLTSNKSNITLRYTFYVKELRETLSFYINSKLLGYDLYDSDKPDLYLIGLEFTRMPPRILIELLGNYLEEKESRDKRAVERVSINPEKLESFLFMDGNGKKCMVTEISLFSAKITVTGNIQDYIEGSTVLLIMKSKELEGLGEMIGNIRRVEEIDKNEEILSVIILFDQEKIPPTYKLWVTECIDKVINKSLSPHY